MNESFFGKYSVFCVFGSVVGCVVVPLVAQLVQQQVCSQLNRVLIILLYMDREQLYTLFIRGWLLAIKSKLLQLQLC